RLVIDDQQGGHGWAPNRNGRGWTPAAASVRWRAGLLLPALGLGGRGGGRGGGALFRLCLLFLGLLGLVGGLQHADLGQPVGAAAFLPALVVLQYLDALAARQHVARADQLVLAAKAFIDGHFSPVPSGACRQTIAIIESVPPAGKPARD